GNLGGGRRRRLHPHARRARTGRRAHGAACDSRRERAMSGQAQPFRRYPADVFLAHAHYNRWMNERIYDCAERLTDEERKRDLGAFFRSVHMTLNHLLMADRVWLERFGCPREVWQSLDVSGKEIAVTGFDDDLYPD